MSVDLPPEVIEEAVRSIGFTDQAVRAGAEVTAAFDIRTAAPVIAAYVRAQTLKEVRAAVLAAAPPYGAELRPDGNEDPGMSVYMQGFEVALSVIDSLAEEVHHV